MKNSLLIVLCAVCIGVLVRADSTPTKPHLSAQMTRACIFAKGGWTTVDCSAGVAYSAALTKWTRYVLQSTGDAFFAQGDAASAQDADSSDGYLPQGAWVEMLTDNTEIYFSCEASGSSGKVRYLECQ